MKKHFRLLLLPVLGISGLFLLTHLPHLTQLPVFADESIYIRWAQLILDDWRQYAFFPLNDGKTPLFVWLTALSLRLVNDPLIAGRGVAVVAGLFQVWLTLALMKKLGAGKLGSVVSAVLIFFLPFWYFHHRIALMDGLMVALLSCSWLMTMGALTAQKQKLLFVLLGGTSFGLALLTKLPALLFAPALALSPFLVSGKKQKFKTLVGVTAGVLFIGLGVFGSLKLHPAFSQLFTRGNDFLYSLEELRAQGLGHVILSNLRNALGTLGSYMTLPVLLLPLVGLFQDSWRKKHALLLLSALAYLGPIALLGKTVYPRYFLPMALPLTLSAALAFEQFFLTTQRSLKKPLSLLLRAAFLVLGVSFTLSASLEFLLVSWHNTDALPFVASDRSQYVTEWSSGHGIKEATEYLLAESEDTKIAVATEGYFGTLPDGILMYLHNQDVRNIMVEGIGQPVHSIPESFRTKAQNYDNVWLIVNSHREKLGLKENHLDWQLTFYCRPTGSPCLEVWDITSLVKPSTKKQF